MGKRREISVPVLPVPSSCQVCPAFVVSGTTAEAKTPPKGGVGPCPLSPGCQGDDGIGSLASSRPELDFRGLDAAWVGAGLVMGAQRTRRPCQIGAVASPVSQPGMQPH